MRRCPDNENRHWQASRSSFWGKIKSFSGGRTLRERGQLAFAGVLEAADVELALALVADDHGARAEAVPLEVGRRAEGAAARHRLQRHQQLSAPARGAKEQKVSLSSPSARCSMALRSMAKVPCCAKARARTTSLRGYGGLST